MIRRFVITRVFDSLWKSLGLQDEDLRQLEQSLLQNPASGPVIRGTGGLRKLRWRKPGTGKSGGIRVLYVDFPEHEILYLISIINKTEKENLSDADKKQIRSTIESIEQSLRPKA